MIYRVDRTSARPILPQNDFSNPTGNVKFPDKLLSAQRQSPVLKGIETALIKIWTLVQKTPALRGVRNFLARVYNWLLQNVFFLFYDEDEETNNRYLIKLDKFYDLYLEMAPAATPAGQEKVKNKFFSLEKGLRNMIREELINVLKVDQNDLTTEQIEERVEQVLENPFLVFNAERRQEGVDPRADPNVSPLARAICSIRDKL